MQGTSFNVFNKRKRRCAPVQPSQVFVSLETQMSSPDSVTYLLLSTSLRNRTPLLDKRASTRTITPGIWNRNTNSTLSCFKTVTRNGASHARKTKLYSTIIYTGSTTPLQATATPENLLSSLSRLQKEALLMLLPFIFLDFAYSRDVSHLASLER
jgi:hypothetical protein